MNKKTHDIPVIFLTRQTDTDDETKGVEALKQTDITPSMGHRVAVERREDSDGPESLGVNT
jgi:response regulator RpfG family c-di-GMP phosphodiesterase